MRSARPPALLLMLWAIGCGGGTASQQAPSPAVEPAAGEPKILVQPFTADEIRDEWTPGLQLTIRRSFPGDTRIERWTVLAADDDGAEIEYATIADDGAVIGEPSVARSGWVELRDHASFPAAHSTREWTRRSTALGEHEGWLYRVADPEAATVQEFFFVPTLPGAPVQMRILEGETAVFELEQIARVHPNAE